MGDLMAGIREVPNVHMVVVHFPIALLPVSLGLDLLGVLFGSRDLHAAGRWCLWLGTLAAAVAVWTGEAGADEVHASLSDAAKEIVESHMDLQWGATIAAVGLSLWRLAVRAPFPTRGRAVYLVLASGVVAILLVASDLGGQLVYLHGVGVRADGDSLQGR
jgi:uncharacterized membrane protein